MPELPEVESQASDLRRWVNGRRITDVWVGWKKTVATPSTDAFKKTLTGKRFGKIERRGKFIITHLVGAGPTYVLVSHFRMTGHFRIAKLAESKSAEEWYVYPPDRFTRVAFKLAPKSGSAADVLHYSDIRKFGRLWLIPESKLATLEELKDLGPEPLAKDFSAEKFAQCLRRYRGIVKPTLLNQSCVAGIGNIYADESLFDAGIHPTTRIDKLSDAELKILGRMVISNLADAVGHRGSSVGEYIGMRGQPGKHGLYLRVYGRRGQPCKSRRTGKLCRGTVKRIVVGQRGTHYCPACQRPRR